MAELRIEHGQKSYVLKPKLITGELIDAVTPIREKMKELASQPAIIEAALNDSRIFELVDPNTGGIRDGKSKEDIAALMSTNQALVRAVNTPTVGLTTDKAGRKLMAELIQITVDRNLFSEELKNDIDSQHFKKVVAKPIAHDELGEPLPQELETIEPSTFWNTFPIDIMIEYVESFCKRARI